jgi:hypothetical protein
MTPLRRWIGKDEQFGSLTHIAATVASQPLPDFQKRANARDICGGCSKSSVRRPMHRDQHKGMSCSVENPEAGDLAAIINVAGVL